MIMVRSSFTAFINSFNYIIMSLSAIVVVRSAIVVVRLSIVPQIEKNLQCRQNEISKQAKCNKQAIA